MSGITADRGFTWSDEETALLLDLWSANDAQSELTGNKRNFPVYEKISESMNNMGYMRTASQCREKIKRMKREYSLTKQRRSSRFGPKKNMRFFEQFHKILLAKQNRNQKTANFKSSRSPAKKFETGESNYNTKRSTEKIDRKLNAGSKSKHSKRGENSDKDDDNPWTPDVLLIEGEETPDPLFDSPGSPSISINGDLSENKEQTVILEVPFLKSVMDTLSLKLMKYQTESDARILAKLEELENERTAMDERIKTMWLNFEERRKIEEKKHENNMMKIFHDIISQVKGNNVAST